MTDSERGDIQETLEAHRGFLRQTARGLTDEQAALNPTVSALSLGGLIKHVSETERHWVDFILEGTQGLAGPTPASEWGPAQWQARADEFRMLPGETLAGLLADYAQVAARTDRLVMELPDLDVAHPLPRGAVVPDEQHPLGPPGLPAHRGRNRAACGARRHHPGDHRRGHHHVVTDRCSRADDSAGVIGPGRSGVAAGS